MENPNTTRRLNNTVATVIDLAREKICNGATWMRLLKLPFVHMHFTRQDYAALPMPTDQLQNIVLRRADTGVLSWMDSLNVAFVKVFDAFTKATPGDEQRVKEKLIELAMLSVVIVETIDARHEDWVRQQKEQERRAEEEARNNAVIAEQAERIREAQRRRGEAEPEVPSRVPTIVTSLDFDERWKGKAFWFVRDEQGRGGLLRYDFNPDPKHPGHFYYRASMLDTAHLWVPIAKVDFADGVGALCRALSAQIPRLSSPDEAPNFDDPDQLKLFDKILSLKTQPDRAPKPAEDEIIDEDG